MYFDRRSYMIFQIKMFYHLFNFCSRKSLYQATIFSCYQDYSACYNQIKNKDCRFDSFMDKEKYDQLKPETKTLITKNSKRQSEIVKEMVSLVKIYCQQFPNEPICYHCNFKTYDEYPYRLPQSMNDFIKLL